MTESTEKGCSIRAGVSPSRKKAVRGERAVTYSMRGRSGAANRALELRESTAANGSALTCGKRILLQRARAVGGARLLVIPWQCERSKDTITAFTTLLKARRFETNVCRGVKGEPNALLDFTLAREGRLNTCTETRVPGYTGRSKSGNFVCRRWTAR